MISKPQEPTRLAQQARDVLEATPHFCGRSHVIRIDDQDGVLHLQGTLPTFYLKQLLQSRLMELEGVCGIENHVVVPWPMPAGDLE